MRHRWILLGGIVCVVVVLAVALLGAHAAGLVCFSRGPGGPATVSQGPVTFGTDHSVYATSDTITVTLTNHLDTSIALVSQPPHGGGTCPLIVLVKIDSAQGDALTPCYGGGIAPSISIISIPAGSSGGVAQFNNANPAISLSDGTYQVYTRYFVSGPGAGGVNLTNATGIASPTFRVCTCRIC